MRQHDTVDGYRLEVGPSWFRYDPAFRATLCNAEEER